MSRIYRYTAMGKFQPMGKAGGSGSGGDENLFNQAGAWVLDGDASGTQTWVDEGGGAFSIADTEGEPIFLYKDMTGLITSGVDYTISWTIDTRTSGGMFGKIRGAITGTENTEAPHSHTITASNTDQRVGFVANAAVAGLMVISSLSIVPAP